MTTIEARIETTPPDNSGPGPDHRTELLVITAGSYAAAYAQAREQVPAGWRLVNVRTIG